MKPILYINPLGDNIVIHSINNTSHTADIFSTSPLTFAEKFPQFLTNAIQKHNYGEIWLLSGPGPFTRMRIITLAINAIKFSFPNIIIKGVHFFDICTYLHYAPLIEVNANEFLTQNTKGEEVFYLKNNLPKGKYLYISSTTSTLSTNTCLTSTQLTSECRTSTTSTEQCIYGEFTNYYDDIDTLQKIFHSIQPQSYIQPFYIKPPHITYAKK